MFLPDLKPSHL
uniref:Uncharacterized protein n=1 Tax=Anguilla anguilla TaxID=7936 RepID=A0A0E9PU93_ANGAN